MNLKRRNPMSDPKAEITLTNDLDRRIEALNAALQHASEMSKQTMGHPDEGLSADDMRKQTTMVILLTISSGILLATRAMNEMNKRQQMIETIIYNRDQKKEGADGASD